MHSKEDLIFYEFEEGREENKVDLKAKEKELCWNVLTHNYNGSNIEVCNVFHLNWPLNEALKKLGKKKDITFEKFEEEVRSNLQWQLWSRCEYEVIVCGWPAKTHINREELTALEKALEKEEKRFEENKWTNLTPYVDNGYPEPAIKIDVFTQIMLNWKHFIKYVWENKNLLKKL